MSALCILAPGAAFDSASATTNAASAHPSHGALSPFLSPTITSLDPTVAKVGSTVTVNGTQFIKGVEVTFNGAKATKVDYISPHKLTAVVPTKATSGPVRVTTRTGTATKYLTILTSPRLSSFSPKTAVPGSLITIKGLSFVSGQTTVRFNGARAANITYVSSDEVVAQVPLTATTGPITVTTPAGSAASAAFSVKQGRESVGVVFNCTNVDAATRAAVWPHLRSAHVEWVRLYTVWTSVQPGHANTPANLSVLDTCVNQAHSYGIKVLLDLYGAFKQATIAQSEPKQYADTLASLVSRYRAKVPAYEIWNEENDGNTYWPGGTVGQYVSLLKAAYTRAKAVDPRVLIVFGGTTFSDDGFVSAAYRAGAKRYFDVMAIHPYQVGSQKGYEPPPSYPDPGSERYFTHAVAVRNVMVANADGEKPVWFTESGWSLCFDPSVSGSPCLGTSSRAQAYQVQADDLAAEYTYVQNHWPWATNVYWFEANPSHVDPWDDGLTLLDEALNPLPDYYALKSWGASP